MLLIYAFRNSLFGDGEALIAPVTRLTRQTINAVTEETTSVRAGETAHDRSLKFFPKRADNPGGRGARRPLRCEKGIPVARRVNAKSRASPVGGSRITEQE